MPTEYALIDPRTGKSVKLPLIAMRALVRVLAEVSLGKAITVSPVQDEITSFRAAEILNVPHEYLLELVQRGELTVLNLDFPGRLSLQEVMKFKIKMLDQQTKHMGELVDLTQSLGIYDEDFR